MSPVFVCHVWFCCVVLCETTDSKTTRTRKGKIQITGIDFLTFTVGEKTGFQDLPGG